MRSHDPVGARAIARDFCKYRRGSKSHFFGWPSVESSKSHIVRVTKIRYFLNHTVYITLDLKQRRFL